MKTLLERIARLITVKSIVTLTLTGVFAYLSIAGKVDETFMSVYLTVIAFYFGTQYEKARIKVSNAGGVDTVPEGECLQCDV